MASDQDEANTYRGDPIFKGCTRPAMVLGVPLFPFFIVNFFIVMVAVWIWFGAIALVPVAVMVMRQITKHDDQQFRLLGLKLLFRLVYFNRNGRFWGAATYSPIRFKKRKRQ